MCVVIWDVWESVCGGVDGLLRVWDVGDDFGGVVGVVDVVGGDVVVGRFRVVRRCRVGVR